jgi:phosphoserine phosphatase
MSDHLLPSWRPGATRDSLVAFLDASVEVPVEQRLATLDNDGTLWCEKPTYVQFDFLVDALASAAGDDPSLAERPEFAAVLAADMAAIGELGLERVGMALLELFEGVPPEVFTAAVRHFLASARHHVLGRPLLGCVYQPMLEVLHELRRRDFTIALVTGGGTEFVRAISEQCYAVPPERVVGTLIDYDFTRDANDRIVPRRANRLVGGPNEGAAKVTNIQTQLGRRPIFAAGNSGGDREMMEWALHGDGPGLALLVDHDDAEREFAYVSAAGTFVEPEPITDVARRLGFTIASMANDWSTVFPDASPGGASVS